MPRPLRHDCSSAADASSIQFVIPFGELLLDDDKASRFLVLSMRRVMVCPVRSANSDACWFSGLIAFAFGLVETSRLTLSCGRNAVENRGGASRRADRDRHPGDLIKQCWRWKIHLLACSSCRRTRTMVPPPDDFRQERRRESATSLRRASSLQYYAARCMLGLCSRSLERAVGHLFARGPSPPFCPSVFFTHFIQISKMSGRHRHLISFPAVAEAAAVAPPDLFYHANEV